MASEIEPPMIIRAPEAEAFLRANPAFCARTGLSADELQKQPLLDFVDPDDRACVEALLRSGQAGSCRAGHRTRDGRPLPLDLHVRPTPSGTTVLGVPPAVEAADRSDEEYDEATVAGTLETIARIVEDQNPGYLCSILLVDRDRFVRGAGPSLPEAYNAAIDGESIGPTTGSCGTAIYWNVPVVTEDIQADPLWRPFAELAKEAGVAACWSHAFTSSGGQVLGALALYATQPQAPTDDQLRSLKAAALMTGLAVERGRAEEALREQRKREAELEQQLRQAAKMEAIGVLAGGIAHDFNNLLATITGNAELALMQLPPTHPTRERLDRIVVASQRAGEFCGQMLAYAGRGSIRSGRVEMRELLSEVRHLADAALSKKATLTYSLHEGLIYLDADENQLLQVVLNLVTNAAEAIGDEEGQIEVSTSLAHYDEASLFRLAPDLELAAGHYVRLVVQDTGCGMDDATRSRIFDPFFTTKFTGRGLGLAAVRGIVRRHNGVILVESQQNVGTTFEVLLPTITAAKTDEPSAPQPSRGRTTGTHVLVVDDEDEPREAFRMMLENAGFGVVEAVNGEDAIEVFGQDPDRIDCVLLDLSMPRLGGAEVLRELHRIRTDIPVVLISGFSEQEIFERLDGASIAGTLQKPFAAAELVETLRAVTPA